MQNGRELTLQVKGDEEENGEKKKASPWKNSNCVHFSLTRSILTKL